VLGCNPYLESLTNYIDRAPPWTATNRGHGITSQPPKHYPETPPRDFKELRTNTDQSCSINQVIFIIHVSSCQPFLTNPHSYPSIESMPTQPLYFISMSFLFDTNCLI